MHPDEDKRWEDQAACANVRKLDWFSSDPDEKYECRAICQAACPVRKECISAALEEKRLFGIWGGVDDYEIRRTLSVDSYGEPKVRRRAPRCPYCMSRKLNIAGSKTRKGYATTCESCGLSWYMAVIPTKLKTSKRAV